MAALNLGDQLRHEKDYLGAINAYAAVGDARDPDPDLKQKAQSARPARPTTCFISGKRP